MASRAEIDFSRDLSLALSEHGATYHVSRSAGPYVHVPLRGVEAPVGTALARAVALGQWLIVGRSAGELVITADGDPHAMPMPYLRVNIRSGSPQEAAQDVETYLRTGSL
ncbi:hypothetical protein [Streptomyces jumonjinensis]|uniref:Uncharacterized protein n=1 Tax=Streptomyces jumonjinensis TaxID=1945 RepID=A0A646KAC0_STRJU|nr:hypothetical protein [Streptomyces jumonjinensis]MQS99039.1 hypothetical protein [Streptomyces jumonjinensis]